MNGATLKYKNYLLTVLLVILAFNFVDRLTLGLVLQEVKVDLSLSDSQLGFLSGIAYALFYSVMGIPLARWADSGNRVTIIALAAAVWSVAVVMCGIAASFTQLLLIRIVIGVGEAGCMPPGHSLIADYFTRAERPRAAAIYSLGAPLSMVIGYFLAGWLNELYGWRLTFILLGLPGLGLAVLAACTLKEPRRAKLPRNAAPELGAASLGAAPFIVARPAAVSFREVCVTLWKNRTFRHLLAGFSALSFFADGILQWQPAFFVRSYGLKTGPLGTWFALIYGVGGLLGTYGGGVWAARHPHNERLHLKVAALLYAGLGLISPFVYLAPNPYEIFALLTVGAVGYYWTFGPCVAAIQTLVSERMRATAFALLYLFVNLVGSGLGPLAIGTLSDLFQPWAGKESLRYALMILSPGYFWVAWHIWRGSATVTADLQAVQAAAVPYGDEASSGPGWCTEEASR